MPSVSCSSSELRRGSSSKSDGSPRIGLTKTQPNREVESLSDDDTNVVHKTWN